MKKRPITLLEIMIVIFLIGVVGSIVGVNIKKSLEKTKLYQTRVQTQKFQDAITMYSAETDTPVESIIHCDATILDALKNSYLFKDQIQSHPEKLLQDPWGGSLTFTINPEGELIVTSPILIAKEKQNSESQASAQNKRITTVKIIDERKSQQEQPQAQPQEQPQAQDMTQP